MAELDLNLLFSGYGVAAGSMLLLWLFQLKTGRATIVDVGWAASLAGFAIYYALAADGADSRRLLIGLMAGGWGVRLTYFLYVDRVAGKEEDGRYYALRNHWGDRANFYFFFFFQAQALLAAILSLSFLVIANDQNSSLGILELFGIFIWLLSVGGETLADKQLSQFRNNPENKGKTCRVGLWKYSRHPNYFFEWLHWWSYVAVAGAADGFLLTLIAPALMYIFITKLTGIPYTEIQALKSRGDDYREYQRTTSVLIPWFPKRSV